MSIQTLCSVIAMSGAAYVRRHHAPRLVEELRGGAADRRDWLGTLLAPLGVKRRIQARDCLFSIGDKATHYYLVESGQLVLHRAPRRGEPAVRVAEPGALLIYDCDGSHAAECHATQDTVVLALDRRRLETRARLDPALRGALNRVHASELGMILESLGVESPRQPDLSHRSIQAEPRRGSKPTRGRWQPYVAHRARTV